MRKSKNEKLKLLLLDKRSFYHTQDLAVLWGIDNKNTLYTTIKRYVKKGVLNNIYKGFYSTGHLKDADPVVLGLAALRRYGYLSTESVLAKNGVIFQDIKYVTFVSDFSKRFKINGYNFLVRKMKEKYLYNGAGVIFDKKIRTASSERAVADMLYFKPNYYFDAKKAINWSKIKEIQKTVGY